MAHQSTCVKCGGTQFEFVDKGINNAMHPLYLVQCMTCGGVAGVVEGIADRLARIEKALKIK